jgi:hypothetical protein
MNSVFEGLIGQRMHNKYIQHAYDKDYKGSHDDLLDVIDALESVVSIAKTSITDVIRGEIDVLSVRLVDEPDNQRLTMFIAGLLHACDIIEEDKSLIGKGALE